MTVAVLGMLSTGLGRRPLRTTIVAAMDIKTNRKIYKIATIGGTVLNTFFRANIRWQTLAEPFLNYCDGVHTPLFEEFACGVQAISATPEERRKLLRDPAFRREFRKQWESPHARVFHRDLADMWIVSSPVPGQEGKSFGELAYQAGSDPLEYFLDLLAEHDSAIRWKTVVTNDRAEQRQFLFAHDTALPGFNDSGAHARNMAFQDGGLQMLQQVLLNPGLMPIEKAIHKLTGESATWLGLDTGFLRQGAHADVVVIDPVRWRTGLGPPIEHFDPRFARAPCEWSASCSDESGAPGLHRRQAGLRCRAIRAGVWLRSASGDCYEACAPKAADRVPSSGESPPVASAIAPGSVFSDLGDCPMMQARFDDAAFCTQQGGLPDAKLGPFGGLFLAAAFCLDDRLQTRSHRACKIDRRGGRPRST